ncbi:hypothetical protein Q5752_005488 [Cryptotrichosporon argae]
MYSPLSPPSRQQPKHFPEIEEGKVRSRPVEFAITVKRCAVGIVHGRPPDLADEYSRVTVSSRKAILAEFSKRNPSSVMNLEFIALEEDVDASWCFLVFMASVPKGGRTTGSYEPYKYREFYWDKADEDAPWCSSVFNYRTRDRLILSGIIILYVAGAKRGTKRIRGQADRDESEDEGTPNITDDVVQRLLAENAGLKRQANRDAGAAGAGSAEIAIDLTAESDEVSDGFEVVDSWRV